MKTGISSAGETAYRGSQRAGVGFKVTRWAGLGNLGWLFSNYDPREDRNTKEKSPRREDEPRVRADYFLA